MDERERIEKIFAILEKATQGMPQPMVTQIEHDYGRDPYLILISCLLSLRARDVMTYRICKELFKRARTPQQMITLPVGELETLFKPIGFYRRKAKLVIEVSKELIERFGSKVPATEEELLSLHGVGRKTANLVLSEGFDIPAICVDTHVHRVSNRLGIVKTKTPEQTEEALKKILPPSQWSKVNRYLVIWGQNICVPISPFVSRCALAPYCPRIGVKKSR